MTSTGAIIMSAFGVIWWVVGLRATGQPSLLTYGVPLAVAVAITAACLRGRVAEPETDEERRRRGRLVGIASAAEGVAIFIVVNVLVNVGLRDEVAPAIALIVGLHFLPLARWLPARPYYVTAATLAALGLGGFLIQSPERRLALVSAGAACTLWVTSLAAAWQRRPAKVSRDTRRPAA